MVTQLAQDDVLELSMEVTAFGVHAFVIRHYLVSLVVGGPDLEHAAELLDLNVYTNLHGNSVVGHGSPGCFLERIWPNSSPKVHSNVLGDTGGPITHALPLQCCALIRLHTGYHRLMDRGRVFVPFPPQPALEDNLEWVPPYLAGLQVTADVLATNQVLFQGEDSCLLVPCIWHRGPQTVTAVISATAKQGVATQRRRNRRLGFTGQLL